MTVKLYRVDEGVVVYSDSLNQWRLTLPAEREGVEVRAARLAQIGRGERAAELPDEVHLGVERLLCDARLVDEQDAAVEEAAGAGKPEHDGEPGVRRVPDGRHEPDGDAGADEDAEREVEDAHAPLKQTRA